VRHAPNVDRLVVRLAVEPQRPSAFSVVRECGVLDNRACRGRCLGELVGWIDRRRTFRDNVRVMARPERRREPTVLADERHPVAVEVVHRLE
jgi:hypothetical protein